MTEVGKIFEPYAQAPVTAESYKELGQKIRQYSQPEREDLFENFHPHELHVKLLKLTLARTLGCVRPLLDGLKDECKYVSKFCLNSRLLFCGGNAELLDKNFLIPLLQTVSSSTRNGILWNLGKYASTCNHSVAIVAKIDGIYEAVSKVWGSNIAAPLLCRASKKLVEQELPEVSNLSNGHLLILAKRFPNLALSFLERQSGGCSSVPHKAARYIVRETLPKSLEYIKKQNYLFLPKSTMRFILQNYSDIILASPSSWLNVLDKRVVKKILKPERFQLFLSKQLLNEKDLDIPYDLREYFDLMSPTEMSVLFNNVFQEKFGCSVRSKLGFWENNPSILECLDASDRSFIAVELDKKNTPSKDWLPLMTTDLSIPRIKKILSTEQDLRARGRLISQLVESALLNKDQEAIEDICNLVVNRYRNDKDTVRCFFNTEIDFLSLSSGTFSLVHALAKRFYVPEDWQTQFGAKLFPIELKRRWGESALKEFIENIMNSMPYFLVSDLYDLESEFRLISVNEVFTASNIEDEKKLSQLANFLSLITKWVSTSSLYLITGNVKKSILTMLRSDMDRDEAMKFVRAHEKLLDLEFIKECFQEFPDAHVMAHLFSRNSHILTTEHTMKKIGKHILQYGVKDFGPQLTKMKKLGYVNAMHCFSAMSKEAIGDPSVSNCTSAVLLLMLTSDPNDFFLVLDPLLPVTETADVAAISAAGEGPKRGRYAPFNASKREDSIHHGFGLSMSRLSLPSLATERLCRFCVNGDLILFVRDAVYSVCSFLPNQKAKAFLLSLMQRPVSVKKHAFRLLWRTVCNIETKEELLVKLMESEHHLSMRTILMDTAIASLNICKYLSMWKVVKEMIMNLTPDDKVIVQSLVNQMVPDPFLEEYFHILIEKCKSLKEVDTTNLINCVLTMLCRRVSLMTENFIESLIVEFFLSQRFIESAYYHDSISELVTQYLQGIPASGLPTSQVPKVVEPRKSLESRQQFLKERLDACAIEGPRDVFSTEEGVYPVRRLLTGFVEMLCRKCLTNQSKQSSIHQLTEYLDFFLTYFSHFNQHAVFLPHFFLSVTNIMAVNTSQPPFVLGQKLGEFSDSMMLKKHSAALLCFYPMSLAKFFKTFVMDSSLFTSAQFVDILSGMISTVPPNASVEIGNGSLQNLLLLISVAHILPLGWLKDDECKKFRESFLVLIKNTPVEVFLFSLGQ